MIPSSQFLAEVYEQPDVLGRQLKQGRKAAQLAAASIKEFTPEWVLIAARGSSDNAARYAQYLLGAHNHLSVGLAVPSLISVYRAHPQMGRAAVIGISQSGQSPDVVAVLEQARQQGALTLAVTNDVASPLARVASLSLPLYSGIEVGIAATKTYTAELAALAMLSASMEVDTEHFVVLQKVPGYVHAVLAAMDGPVQQVAEQLAGSDRLVVLGRGFNYSTAFEIALKVKELCLFGAEAYSFADLMHGPVAMIDRGFPCMLVAPSGPTLADVPKLLTLLKQRGGRTIAISDNTDVLACADYGLYLPANLPEWLTPIVAVVVGQLFAHALCLASGQDPDKPRGLSKITLTL